jgi:putative holliday junction resolvase
MERIMAIDFGERRIGLALSDPTLLFAYPYETVLNDDKLWGKLKGIIEEKEVKKILLGYPLKFDNSRTHATAGVEKFKAEIEKRFKLEVELWDERFTSEMAKESILQTVTKKSKRREKGLVDRTAAAIILQEYLDEKGKNRSISK